MTNFVLVSTDGNLKNAKLHLPAMLQINIIDHSDHYTGTGSTNPVLHKFFYRVEWSGQDFSNYIEAVNS